MAYAEQIQRASAQHASMRTRRGLAYGLIVAWSVALCVSCSSEAPKGAAGGPKKAEAATVVEMARASRGAIKATRTLEGVVVTDRVAEIATDLSGRVVSVEVEVGDRVERGQALLALDPVPLQQRVRELEAAVRMAQARTRASRAAQANLRAELDRKAPLAKDGLVTPREVEDLKARLNAAEHNTAVSRASADQERARLRNAREDLQRSRLKAPFAGVIQSRNVQVGEHVSAGEATVRLVGSGPRWLRVAVPQGDVKAVIGATTADVRLLAFPGVRCEARVARKAPALDETTRTLRVDLLLTDACTDSLGAPLGETEAARVQEALRPGMVASATLRVASKDEALQVPRQAVVVRRDGAPVVWVSEDGKARPAPVRVGLETPSKVEVIDGLKAGVWVILRGQERLKPGQAVKPVTRRGGSAPDATQAAGGAP